jgi:hypothetical protein
VAENRYARNVGGAERASTQEPETRSRQACSRAETPSDGAKRRLKTRLAPTRLPLPLTLPLALARTLALALALSLPLPLALPLPLPLPLPRTTNAKASGPGAHAPARAGGATRRCS